MLFWLVFVCGLGLGFVIQAMLQATAVKRTGKDLKMRRSYDIKRIP